jgi:hypothetical protein
MPWFRLLVELTALTFGFGYLYLNHRQRIRNSAPRDDPEKWTGRGIEASELKVRVKQVRQDYLSARQATRGVCFHRYLLGFARQAIIRLEYFRHRNPEEHAHGHGS